MWSTIKDYVFIKANKLINSIEHEVNYFETEKAKYVVVAFIAKESEGCWYEVLRIGFSYSIFNLL